MAKWFVVLQPISGRAGAVTIEADEMLVVGGHLFLRTDDQNVAAIAPGTWVSVEREDVSYD